MLTKKDLALIDAILAKRIRVEIDPIKKDVSQIRKDVKIIVNFFDREYLELRKRIERIEKHLDLSPLL